MWTCVTDYVGEFRSTANRFFKHVIEASVKWASLYVLFARVGVNVLGINF